MHSWMCWWIISHSWEKASFILETNKTQWECEVPYPPPKMGVRFQIKTMCVLQGLCWKFLAISSIITAWHMFLVACLTMFHTPLFLLFIMLNEYLVNLVLCRCGLLLFLLERVAIRMFFVKCSSFAARIRKVKDWTWSRRKAPTRLLTKWRAMWQMPIWWQVPQ